MLESLITRCRRGVLLLVVLSLPPFAWGAWQALASNANDVKDWLPAGYAETQRFDWFCRHFAEPCFALVSWTDCTVDDPRLADFSARIVGKGEQTPCGGAAGYFQSVVTGSAALEQLTQPPLSLSDDEACRRLAGSLLGPDRRSTCAMVQLSSNGQQNLHAAVARIRDVAIAECGISADDLKLAGPAVDNVAIDEAGEHGLLRIALAAGLISVAIAWRCLRNVWLVAIVLGVGVYSATTAAAVVWFSGQGMNAILLSMPPLVYVAAVSGAIHLVNYFRAAAVRMPPVNAVAAALRSAVLPLGLATGTTAVGLASLAASDLQPVRMFGIYSATGVALALVWLVSIVPMLLSWGPPAIAGSAACPTAGSNAKPHRSRPLHLLARTVSRHYGWCIAGCLTLLVVCATGLGRLESSVHLFRLFASDARLVQDYAWLEKHVGPMVPLEIVLHVDRTGNEPTLLEQMRWVGQLEAAGGQADHVGGTLSAVTFSPELPPTLTGWRVGQRVVWNRRLANNLEPLRAAGFLATTDSENLWRISLRMKATSGVDFGDVQADVHRRIDNALSSMPAATARPLSVTYTGLAPLVQRAQMSLLDGLMVGLGGDLALIVVLTMIVLRSCSGGLMLLVASVFPVLLVFGLMGWSGMVIDIGAVMPPAVALGVTVDDAVHYLLCYRRERQRGVSQRAAVRAAYDDCGQAMLQSWGIIGLGLAVFALSPFQPTQRFGCLMAVLLTAALLGNLVLLPAMLASPWGRLFAMAANGTVGSRFGWLSRVGSFWLPARHAPHWWTPQTVAP